MVNYFLNGLSNMVVRGWVSVDTLFEINKIGWVKAKTNVPKYFLLHPNFPPALLSGLWSIIKEAVKRAGEKTRKHAKKQMK